MAKPQYIFRHISKRKSRTILFHCLYNPKTLRIIAMSAFNFDSGVGEECDYSKFTDEELNYTLALLELMLETKLWEEQDELEKDKEEE